MNDNIFWALVLSSIAGLSTMLGCIFIFIPIKNKKKFITFSISLSLSVMLSISIFDLIPSSLYALNSSPIINIITFIMCFLLGVILVSILNRAIEKGKKTNNLYKLGILNFIALVMHNLPEGILSFMSTYQDFSLGLSLTIAITLHNVPEGISIAVPIYYATGSRGKAIKSTLLSALAEPIGALLAFLILYKFIDEQLISIFLILVAGIMVTLSINKMLPEVSSYQEKKPMYIGLIIGLIISLMSIFIF